MKMIRWSCLVAASLATAGLLFITTALADNNDANTGAGAPPSLADQPGSAAGQETLQLTGRITAINTAAGRISVKGGLFSKTLKVGPDTQIAVEGKTGATLSDLQVGDRVAVNYHRQGSELIADQVTRTETKESQGGASSGSSGGSHAAQP